MPWKETQKMDQRIDFAMKAQHCLNFGELCKEYGISRKTGYKWRKRYEQRGLAGMAEMSRAPHRQARELPERVVCEMVKLKNAHPTWGPRKIRALYGRKHPSRDLPSESSFKRVLERAGLTKPRKRRRARESGRIAAGRVATAPNEVWSVDFKGWWRALGGERVEPLTVRDEYSRMILELRAVENCRTETIRHCFEALFERYGLPGAIRSDNGPPFASSNGLLGLSRLSAWWLALGIDLERGRPGCPQDNGAHERMHLDVRRELQEGRIGNDQDAFDLWCDVFNNERPHEAIGMACPADLYEPSARRFDGTPDELDYDGKLTRRVHRQHGTIAYQRERIKLSTTLGGWSVGLGHAADHNDERLEVWFAQLLLGHLSPATSSFTPVTPAPPRPAAVASGDSAPLHRPKRRGSSETKKPKKHTQNCNHQ